MFLARETRSEDTRATPSLLRFISSNHRLISTEAYSFRIEIDVRRCMIFCCASIVFQETREALANSTSRYNVASGLVATTTTSISPHRYGSRVGVPYTYQPPGACFCCGLSSYKKRALNCFSVASGTHIPVACCGFLVEKMMCVGLLA